MVPCGSLSQVKADKDSGNLVRLQQASRGVTQATAGVVASTKSGKSQIEETGKVCSCTGCPVATCYDWSEEFFFHTRETSHWLLL